MNAILVKQASELIPNSNVLINIVSRRVRQLNSGDGGTSRPLLADSGNLSAVDIALTELVEGKTSYDMPEFVPVTRQSGKQASAQRLDKPLIAPAMAADRMTRNP